MKKSFVLYNDQYEAIEDLTAEQKGQLLDAMFLYSRGENLKEYEPIVSIVFKFFKIVFDRDHVKWEAVANRNKENGRKGGRPKSNESNDLDVIPEEPGKPSGLIGIPKEPRKAVSVSVSVSGSGNDIKDIPDSNESGKQEFYLTKKKRKLSGKRLETFNTFWELFNYRKGKANAADSWLEIPELSNSLVSKIFSAAKQENANRDTLINKGSTPKWPQGWLTDRRWEDYQEINHAQKMPRF